jgi:hypothetical protein
MDTITTDFKLSESQITKLFAFVEKKFVHWYDLQIEIVDHLASSIETEMQSNPNLTFELALERIYKGFGIFGFAKIVQEKQAQLAKSAKRKWWIQLLSFFKWPRMILFLTLVSAVYTISLLLRSDLLNEAFLYIYITLSLSFFIYVIRDVRLQRRLLLMHYGATYVSIPFAFEFILVSNFTEITSLSFTILLTLGVLIKLTSFNLYIKIRKEAELLYPEVF